MRHILRAIRKAVIIYPGLFLGEWCLRKSVRCLISFQSALCLILLGQQFPRNPCKKSVLCNCIFQWRAHTRNCKSYFIIYFLPDFMERLHFAPIILRREINGGVSPSYYFFKSIHHPRSISCSWATKLCFQLFQRLDQWHRWKKNIK